jgi:hypothetical protein
MPLGIGFQQAPGSVQVRVIPRAGKYIQGDSMLRPPVKHSVGSEQFNPVTFCKHNELLVTPLFITDRMPLNFNKQVSKDGLQFGQPLLCL